MLRGALRSNREEYLSCRSKSTLKRMDSSLHGQKLRLIELLMLEVASPGTLPRNLVSQLSNRKCIAHLFGRARITQWNRIEEVYCGKHRRSEIVLPEGGESVNVVRLVHPIDGRVACVEQCGLDEPRPFLTASLSLAFQVEGRFVHRICLLPSEQIGRDYCHDGSHRLDPAGCVRTARGYKAVLSLREMHTHEADRRKERQDPRGRQGRRSCKCSGSFCHFPSPVTPRHLSAPEEAA